MPREIELALPPRRDALRFTLTVRGFSAHGITWAAARATIDWRWP